MHRRWFLNRTNPEFVSYLSKAASISPILSQVLINRGMKSVSDIRDFLNPGMTGLSDPYELPDMKAAVERVRAAVQRNERVLVHGDYDTDGVTATTIMVYSLRTLGLDVRYFIPNRMLHGYGFNPHAIAVAKQAGAKLIITVDCGITSLEAADLASEEKIDVIITDHHEPLKRQEAGDRSQKTEDKTEFIVPRAVAVINPKLFPHNERFTVLSGAGIAFKFAQALAADGGFRLSAEDTDPLLDLAALGTLADVVPLTGENRIILKEGLRYIHSSSRPAMRALREVSGLNSREVRAGLLSFTIVPRINAAGRIADATDIIRLFLAGSEEEAMDLSLWLDRLNTERQKIEEAVYQEALSRADAAAAGPIVLSGEGWHQGVLGIVASRLAEEFRRPAFIFSVENGIARGSARSIPSFDICSGLAGCKELLLAYGGHKQAAGIKLLAENIPVFEKAIHDVMKEGGVSESLVPTLEIDAEITLPEITHALIKELSLLEPVGFGNPEPLFGSKGLEVLSPKIVGRNHLRLKLKKNSQTIDAIGFDMGSSLEPVQSSLLSDVVFTPAINEWNGGKYLQLVLKAIRPAA
ncbi:MAG: single-stranded-DNA-specific exonuclease RecJ [Nitrospirae bacterium]|nr:single-stranded-DNA-specific exonuclease RecJ [Nitrospirota bacterium]